MFPVHEILYGYYKSATKRFGHVGGGTTVFRTGTGRKNQQGACNNSEKNEYFFHKFWIFGCVKVKFAAIYFKRSWEFLYCLLVKGAQCAFFEMTKFAHEQAANLPELRTRIYSTITESIFHEIRTATPIGDY
jgi:hypothetical protein